MVVGEKQPACGLLLRQMATAVVFVILGASISCEANIQELNTVKYVH